MSIKFTKQDEVLSKMDEGWALCRSSGGFLTTRTWLQQNGCGRGGATLDVHGNTFHSLYRKQLITRVQDGYPTSCWGLNQSR